MAKTKIIVLQKKKLLTIGIPAVLLILLLALFLAFGNKKNPAAEPGTPQDTPDAATATYKPGVYSSVLSLNDSSLNLEVVVDKDHINSVRLVNLDEATAAMYPLMEPSISDLSDQLSAGTEIDDLQLSESSRYTQTLLIEGIRQVLSKAAPEGK